MRSQTVFIGGRSQAKTALASIMHLSPITPFHANAAH